MEANLAKRKAKRGARKGRPKGEEGERRRKRREATPQMVEREATQEEVEERKKALKFSTVPLGFMRQRITREGQIKPGTKKIVKTKPKEKSHKSLRLPKKRVETSSQPKFFERSLILRPRKEVEFEGVKEEIEEKPELAISEPIKFSPPPPERVRKIHRPATRRWPKTATIQRRTPKLEDVSPSPEKTLERLRQKERMASIAPPSAGGRREPSLDFYDIFLEFPNGGKRSVVDPKEPVCIVIPELKEDDYLAGIQLLCRDIYRERVGGLPSPISSDDKLAIEEKITEGTIRVVEKGEDKIRTGVNQILVEKDVRNEITKFFSQELGFLLFPVEAGHVGEKVVEICEKLEREALPKRPYIIPVRPKIVGVGGLSRKISSISWGFLDIEPLEGESFSSYFLQGEREFKDWLQAKLEDTVYEEVTVKDPNVSESWLHYMMKAYVVRYLARKRKLRKRKQIEKRIKTEEDVDGNIRPDVKEGMNVYEIETFFGEGFDPDDKINEKMENYKFNKRLSINFVLPNLTFLRYLSSLKRKRSHWRQEGYKVEFQTLDMRDGTLISLDEVEKELRKIALLSCPEKLGESARSA